MSQLAVQLTEQAASVKEAPSGFDRRVSDLLLRRYATLLNLGDLLAHRQSLSELLIDLAASLQQFASFDLLLLALHHPTEKVMRVTLVDQEKKATFQVDLDSSGSGGMWESQQATVISDVLNDSSYPDTMKYLRGLGMSSACLLPLTLADTRFGVLGFASSTQAAYAQTDLEFLQKLGEVVALAIDNLLTRQSLNRDKQRLELLLEISRALSLCLEIKQIFSVIADGLQRVMALDYAAVSVPDKHKDGVNLYLIHPCLPEYEGQFIPRADSISIPAMHERKVKCYRRADLEARHLPVINRLLSEGTRYVACFPLITPRGVVGALSVASKTEDSCDTSEGSLPAQIANLLAIALENVRAYQEIAELKAKVTEERLYLEDEIRTELHFEEIVGESPQIKRALADAKTVAASDANVLILGETGTGKELIARAIHRMSGRKDHSFIKLNCAAIPTGLLESELFGHEKGAFTGALTQKVGRMELANGGTAFLDEVGDIPLELQPKLLRVLQDQEFERLGSTKTVKVNVRLIAATNRDLANLVAAREFRSDLYYRLRVFPIQLAPLRDRRQDIPLLVRYFVQRLARRMNKVIDSIPTATMDVLTAWDWPGNVRELENFLERSVILSKGPVLTIPAAELRPLNGVNSRRDTSLETAEREHILRILHETGGVISGTRGAAARLGLKRTTLQSKMQKLGISRQDYQS